MVENGSVRPDRWQADTIQIRQQDILVYRADKGDVYSGCLVQLLDSSTRPENLEVTCTQTDREIQLQASCGLSLRLACMPSGEMLESHEIDWRTLPLFRSPAHTLWPGELAEKAL